MRMRTVAREFIVLIVLAWILGTMTVSTAIEPSPQEATTSTTTPKDRPENRELREIIESAPVLPPELEADVLLSLVEHDKIVDPDWKTEVLMKAFQLASSSKYRFDIANFSAIADSDSGSLMVALIPGLSTAGLESRSIAAMRVTNSKLARELFRQMVKPEPETLNCTDDRFASHQAYFNALGLVAKDISPEEQRLGVLVSLMNEMLRSVATPEDFALSLDLIRTTPGLSTTDFLVLMSSWSESLGRARFQDRIVSWQLRRSFSSNVITAATEVKNKGGSPVQILQALRRFLVIHLSGTRCGEIASSDPTKASPQATAEENLRLSFNKSVAAMAPEISEIRPEETRPRGIEAQAITTLWISTTASELKLAEDSAHLRLGTAEQQAINKLNQPTVSRPSLTLEQRSTPAWTAEALRYLTAIENWSRETGESSREEFYKKAIRYNGFIDMIPDSSTRDTVLKSYVNFLARSPIRRESPPEWVIRLKELIQYNSARDRPLWINKVEDAGDSAIAVYTRVARLTLAPATAR